MTNLPSKKQPSRQPFHWPSFLMVIMAGFSLFVFLGGAGTMLIGGLFALIGPLSDASSAANIFSYALSGLVLSVLLLPTFIFNIQRLSGKIPITSRLLSGRLEKIPLWLLVLLFLLMVAAGTILLQFDAATWLTMPLVNVLTLGLPVLIVMRLGTNRLGSGSLQQRWSAFTTSMVFSPALVFFIEIIGFIFVVIIFALIGPTWFPQFTDAVVDLGWQMQNGSPAQLEAFLLEILQKPGVVAIILSFLSIFVPVVEEILKPFAVWLLARRPLSPQDGWILGLLGGAGFALLENLGNVAIDEGWTFVALARFGATALHMFNTGLIGYTFVLARKENRYLRLLLVVLGTFVIHGLWNGITIFATVRTLASPAGSITTVWPPAFIALLATITAGLVYSLMAINKRLRSAAVFPEIKSESETT
jgi:hypothetical protein